MKCSQRGAVLSETNLSSVSVDNKAWERRRMAAIVSDEKLLGRPVKGQDHTAWKVFVDHSLKRKGFSLAA